MGSHPKAEEDMFQLFFEQRIRQLYSQLLFMFQSSCFLLNELTFCDIKVPRSFGRTQGFSHMFLNEERSRSVLEPQNWSKSQGS